ncbi:MAG: SAM-dependent methyltransferase [Cyanobium sp. PLM2.Bin73]|nr:MAG: SAM-dependent methyltransferase [Cyanobium sp. PLM2.Bin73]
MTCGASEADGLRTRYGADGSFSLWSERFGEGFHGAIGARREARQKFVRPAGLEHWDTGSTLKVVDVGVGLGTNTAALLSAAIDRGLQLRWWGLEIDRRPLQRALAEPVFRRQWPAQTLELLEQLAATGHWRCGCGSGALLWGDARQRLPELLEQQRGQCDLVLLDAFSPQRCPELWSEDFLARLAALLAPRGRLLTYCSAAAVRQSLLQAGLELMAIAPPAGNGQAPTCWSLGTAASPSPLPGGDGVLRPLSAMEREHLATRAAEPYRDPSGAATAEEILSARCRAQASSTAGSTSAWRRRWGLERRSGGRAWQAA